MAYSNLSGKDQQWSGIFFESERERKRKRELEHMPGPVPLTPSGHIDWFNVEPVGTALLFGDSWFTRPRLAALYLQNLELGPYVPVHPCINMEPHLVDQGEGANPRFHNLLRIINHSVGGATFASVLANIESVSDWVYYRPIMTLFHVGACDLAGPIEGNPAFLENSQRWFFNMIMQVALFYRSHGLAHCYTNEAREFVRTAPLCFSFLADWGTAWQPRPDHLAPEDVRYHRRRMNGFAKRNISDLWNNHKVILLCLNQPSADRVGVHLTGRSQIAFARSVKRIIARHCCARCNITYHFHMGDLSRPQVLAVSQKYWQYPSCDRPEGEIALINRAA